VKARPARSAPAINLRPARLADVAELLAMMGPFNRSEGIRWRPKLVAGALRRLLREPRLGAVIVAQDQGVRGALVGYVVATFNYDLEFAGPDAFVTELFVDPASRAAGLGRRLLDAMTAAMRAAGARALHLLVRPDNRRARRLYEKAGFAAIPRLMMTRALPQARASRSRAVGAGLRRSGPGEAR
jgi:ribosomal protein S18 acetylase RimI-like enzyme